MMPSRSSLKRRFVGLLSVSVIAGLIFFGVVFALGNVVVDQLGKSDDFRGTQSEQRLHSLQSYVERYAIAATDSAALLEWCSHQPLVLMEVYRDDKMLFSSAYFDEELLSEKDVDATFYDWYSYRKVTFSDGAAELLLICDDTYQLRTWVTIGAIFAGVILLLVVFMKGVASVATYIVKLRSDIALMESGDLSRPVEIRGTDELAELAESLNSMRLAFLSQREAEALSLQANKSLVAGLSHDLRTPLTKIMLFVEILRNARCAEEGIFDDYLGKIEANAEQIRRLSDDILQYSLTQADGGAMTVAPAPFSVTLCVPLSETADYLAERGFDLGSPPDLPDDEVLVCEESMRRVFDNLASNFDRYADRTKPIVVCVRRDERRVGIVFENSVNEQGSDLVGTGVGLANVRYLMGRMKGLCEVESFDNAFRTILWFSRPS